MRKTTWIAALFLAFAMLVLAQGASAGPRGDLSVQDGHVLIGEVGPGADAVQASQVLNGTWSWFFVIDDFGVAVTNPTIIVDSGFPLSDFPGGLGGATSFPVTMTEAALNPGESFFGNPLAQFGVTTIPVTMSPGFDSTRSVAPLTIPVGGGNQQLTVTITPRTTGPGYKVSVDGAIPGITVSQVSGPSDMNDLQAGTTYTLVYDVNVPNPFGVPFSFKPNVHVNGGTSSSSFDCCTGPTNSISFPDSTLDGGTVGRGHVTYSVDQTVNSWSINMGDFLEVAYDGLVLLPPTSPDQCKNGGWRRFGVFKNQGDCVSYLVTGGDNPPG